MKKSLMISAVMLAAVAARATLYTQSFSGGTIADGNPVGQVFTGTFSAAPSGNIVENLTINLNISGGYNGDLYAYLVAPDGTMVVLMNQPGVALNGFGAGGSGMSITLADGVYPNIQDVTSSFVLSGTYDPAGTLGDFNGSVADGSWQLYFADLSNGGGTSTLNTWSLSISAVPEPVNVAMGVFGAVVIAAGFRRGYKTIG